MAVMPTAAKAAIAHYTRYLAQDLGPFAITVNCIAPGVIAPADHGLSDYVTCAVIPIDGGLVRG
jgi:enoyl-[acyl-carrier-protein] reductase (NADH)